MFQSGNQDFACLPVSGCSFSNAAAPVGTCGFTSSSTPANALCTSAWKVETVSNADPTDLSGAPRGAKYDASLNPSQ